MHDNKDTAGNSDRELLSKLVLTPVRKRSIFEKTLAFLSHSAWQGIGAILGLMSLIVTIFLAFYIYDLTNESQLANMYAATYAGSLNTPDGSAGILQYVSINNLGPSTGQSVRVVINYDLPVDECAPSNDANMAVPTNIQFDDHSCTVAYDNFFP